MNSGYSIYEKMLKIRDLILSGGLYFIDMDKNGIRYTGWIDGKGSPCGIFKVEEEDIDMISNYLNGTPFGFGKLEYKYKSPYSTTFGVINKTGKVDGDGVIHWPSGGVYTGKLSNNFQNGLGFTRASNHDSWMDSKLSGIFEHGKLITPLFDIPEEEYNKNSAANLSPELKFVKDMSLEDGGTYTGNWKDGGPAGFGYKKYYGGYPGCPQYCIGAIVGYENGDHKEYSLLTGKYDDANYYDEKHKNGAVYGYTISVGEFKYAIKIPDNDIFYAYNADFLKGNFHIKLAHPNKSRSDVISPLGTCIFATFNNIEIVDFDYNSNITHKCSISLNGDLSIQDSEKEIIYCADGNVFVFYTKHKWLYDEDKNGIDGIQYCSNGEIFIGTINNKKRNGKGVLLFPDGEVIQQGKWYDGRFSENSVEINTVKSKCNLAEVVSAAKQYKRSSTPTLNQSSVIKL